MKKLLLLFPILSCFVAFSQNTPQTVSMSAAVNNATAFGTSGTIGSNSGATFYVHWDNTYLYLGWSGGNTVYSSDMYYAAIDTDPNTSNGVSAAFNNVGFTPGNGARKPDYLVFYENNGGFHGPSAGDGNAFERWGNSGGAWAYLLRTGGDDGVSSQVVYGNPGEVRLRIAWSDLGSPTRGTDKPIAITMWTNNSSADYMWARFPTENPVVGNTPKTLTHSFIFYNTGTGVNPSSSFVRENNTFTTTNISGTQSLGITVSGNISLSGATNFESNLNILPSSSVSIGANTLTLAGGTVTGSGTLVGSSSSNLTMNGSGAVGTLNFSQTTDGTTNLLNNLTLNRASSGSVTLSNKLILASTLTLSDGTLNTGGNLVLRSNASGTARVAEITGTGSVSGNVIVERYIPAKNKWRFITTPVAGGASAITLSSAYQQNIGSGILLFKPGGGNGFTSGGNAANIRSFDQTTQSWVSLSSTTANNVTGSGSASANNAYCVFVTGPHAATYNDVATTTTTSVTGTLQQGNQTFTIENGANKFSLVGNPYASPIDLNKFYDDNTGSVTDVFYVWDPTTIGGTHNAGGYITCTRTSANTFSYAPVNGIENKFIQSGQAFFVTSSNVGGTSVVFQEDQKASTNFNNPFRTGTQIEVLNINMSFDNGAGGYDLTDGVAALYKNTYSVNTTDPQDAVKFTNGTEALSIMRNNKRYSMEARPLIDANDTIFLHIANMRQVAYNFDFMPGDFSNANGLTGYLQDAFTGTETPISLNSNTNYIFSVTSAAASLANDRFRVVFRTSTTLPVQITSFKAQQQGSAVNVEWSVSTESGIKNYEVQKSNDGRNFTNIATTAARNISNSSYSAMDNQPRQGINYYRILIKGNDNSIKYSSIVSVKIGSKDKGISVYPNPVVNNTLNLQLNAEKGNYSARLVNNAGQVVWNRSINHNGGAMSENYVLPNLSTGTYRLQVTGDAAKYTQTIIIK